MVGFEVGMHVVDDAPVFEVTITAFLFIDCKVQAIEDDRPLLSDKVIR